jgi:hypothetical protein
MLVTMKNYAEQITKAKSFYLLLTTLEIGLCFVIIKKVACTQFFHSLLVTPLLLVEQH